MITLKQFVGVMMRDLTHARANSDVASAHVANSYLQHDILKGFPVPRMHVHDVEMQLKFAVAEPYVNRDVTRENALHRIVWFATAPIEQIQREFDMPELWRSQIARLHSDLNHILSQSFADADAAARLVSVGIENFIYRLAFAAEQRELMAFFQDAYCSMLHVDNNGQPIHEVIAPHIHDLLGTVTTTENTDGIVGAVPLPDLPVLIGAAELEAMDGDQLQSVKLTFKASDRKWVSVEKDGEKQYLLDRQ